MKDEINQLIIDRYLQIQGKRTDFYQCLFDKACSALKSFTLQFQYSIGVWCGAIDNSFK